jgi:UDP-GlcNAc:undecaprenyl-phosphate GlcNAc-1-phosphate transferase
MSNSYLIIYGCLFATALGLSLALTPLARLLARKVGLVDHPGARKIHHEPTPYGGGIAIFATLACILGGCYLALNLIARDQGDWSAGIRSILSQHGGGLVYGKTLWRLAAVLGGATLVFVLGLMDDKRGMNPLPKLAVQALAALLLVAADLRVTFFIDNYVISALLTVLWVVLVTNAFNLLDNMDGLSAGVAAIASAVFFFVALQAGQVFVSAFLAVLAGALLGFLYYNFAPAKLFLGDAGSLFIGFLLAAMTVAGTFYESGKGVYSAFLPVLALGVPLFDTGSVMFIRWRAGKPFFQGDTNHFSHRLVRLGMTRREAVLTIYLLGLILGAAAALLRQLDRFGAVVIFFIGLGIIALIVLLETAAARRGGE